MGLLEKGAYFDAMMIAPQTYSISHPEQPGEMTLSAQNRSIMGANFQEIHPLWNQRLAPPSGETFLGGTNETLELGIFGARQD